MCSFIVAMRGGGVGLKIKITDAVWVNGIKIAITGIKYVDVFLNYIIHCELCLCFLLIKQSGFG